MTTLSGRPRPWTHSSTRTSFHAPSSPLNRSRFSSSRKRSVVIATERVPGEVVAKEGVEAGSPEAGLEDAEEAGPLAVGDRCRRSVVGGAPRQVGDQSRVVGRRRVVGDRLHDVALGQQHLTVGEVPAVERLAHADLEVGGEALVQPEVTPGRRSSPGSLTTSGPARGPRRSPGCGLRRGSSASRR